jgi:L-ascorbate metabolism protein UlaG (beta-lactamase superfamily)
MWKHGLIAFWFLIVLVLSAFLFHYRGWILYSLRQRRREKQFTVRAVAHHPEPNNWRDDQLTFSWLGHSTLLINFFGRRIITDPVFFESVGFRVVGLISFGPKRLIPCALQPDELPPLDLIIQSHAHLDHLDVRSWKQLSRSTAVVMAANNSRHIRHLGFHRVTELHWGESTDAPGARVTAIEARHWGERYPWSKWHGYNAYLLERNGKTILFGGDTAYTEEFRKACAGRKIDVAVLPIGGYEPWIHSHASPEEAWKMFEDIGADYLIPIHHQTFILSYEPPDEPLSRLLAAAGNRSDKVVLREVGETFVLP